MAKLPHRSSEFESFMAERRAIEAAGGPTVTGRLKRSEPEIQNLKPLISNPAVGVAVAFRPERVKDLVRFIKAREAARKAKEAGKPYKGDEIIQTYRFCNMHREDDRVTRWIAANWRDANKEDPHLWFAMCVARMALNSIDSMADLGYPVPWQPKQFLAMVKRRIEKKLKVYGPAYMIATPNWTGPKHLFLIERLLTPLWEQRNELAPRKDDTLASFHARLNAVLNVGSFTAAQVVADMKYVPPLLSASDWATWAAPGPGSMRGLNRVCLRHIDTAWKAADWLATLQRLQKAANSLLGSAGGYHAQDLQNCLCEFDKYERARLGEGKPKQLYVPHKGD